MGTITVSNLGKAYKQYPTRWSRLKEWLDPRNKPRHHLHWVLQGINFTVQPGEAVGIIGINGAGKSTLLKMITGTTQPTTGSVQIKGCVAALLELGMGFHPDFTGRQNAYMAGQLLGYSVEEIAVLMPEIEAFAEIGDYIDQPVRVYSSGMQVRLAFSVATAHRPDVLIVDEALSVGDAYFQQKSFSKIKEFKEKGTTLLFVSHDFGAIMSVCDRAILINEGKIVSDSNPEYIINKYNEVLSSKKYFSEQLSESFGTGEARTVEVSLLKCGVVRDVFEIAEDVCLKVKVVIEKDIEKLVFGFMIRDRLGMPIFGTNTQYTKQPQFNLRKGDKIEIDVALKMNIGPGEYSISTALVNSETHLDKNYEWKDRALMFKVVNNRLPFFIGSTYLSSSIRIERE